MLLLYKFYSEFNLKSILLLGASLVSIISLIYFIVFTKKRGWYLFRTLYYPCILYTLSTFFWILSNVYFHTKWLVTNGEYYANILARLANIFSSFVVLSAFIYSCHLCSNRTDRKIYFWHKIIITIFSIFFLVINIIPKLTVDKVIIIKPSEFIIFFGSYTPIFFSAFLFIALLTCINLVIKNDMNNIIKRTESVYIAVIFITITLSTTILDLIITYVFHKFSQTWIPPTLSVIGLIIIGYTIIHHRFYSLKYLFYLFLNFIIISIIYFIPLFLVFKLLSVRFTLFISLAWTLYYTLVWKYFWKAIGKRTSLILYNDPLTPVNRIENLSDDFRLSIHLGIKNLSELLYIDQKGILISDANTNGIYSSYLLNNDSVLLIEEVKYHVGNDKNHQLTVIRDRMTEQNSAMILPLYDPENTLSRLLITPHKMDGSTFPNEEITAIKNLLQRVQSYIFNEIHVQKSRAVAHSIAHEIRNPLAQVLLQIEEISSLVTDIQPLESINRKIKKAQQAIYHGNQIIDLILQEFQHPTIDSRSIKLYSIHQLVSQVIHDFTFDSKDTLNRVELDYQFDFNVNVNDILFGFILFNLLRNAIYYFNEYPQSTIKISLEVGKDENLLHFKDNGPGIEPHIQHRIFDDFFTYQKSGGTGLGLSYCQRVMHLFDGYISCESVYGKYTIFTLHFPKTAQPPYPLPLKQDQNPATSSAAKIQVLVTDDNSSQRNLIRLYLEKLGVQVEEAENGRKAIEKVQEKTLDLIFMDVQMPVMDGFDACIAIKEQQPQVPIIALSGETNDETLGRMEQIMDDRLSKPTSKKQLEVTLQKWVPLFTNKPKEE